MFNVSENIVVRKNVFLCRIISVDEITFMHAALQIYLRTLMDRGII